MLVTRSGPRRCWPSETKVRSWRFYDTFRTDSGAPARAMQIGTRTLALADDGADLQTIAEIGDAADLDACVDDASPAAGPTSPPRPALSTSPSHQPGLLRPLRTVTLSDGTLRYLLRVAALLSPRPGGTHRVQRAGDQPHRDLLPALARLTTRAATQTQVMVVTHDAQLPELLENGADTTTIRLEKQAGETRILGTGPLDEPP